MTTIVLPSDVSRSSWTYLRVDGLYTASIWGTAGVDLIADQWMITVRDDDHSIIGFLYADTIMLKETK